MANNPVAKKNSLEGRHRKAFRDFIKPIVEKDLAGNDDYDDDLVYPTLKRSLTESYLPAPEPIFRPIDAPARNLPALPPISRISPTLLACPILPALPIRAPIKSNQMIAQIEESQKHIKRIKSLRRIHSIMSMNKVSTVPVILLDTSQNTSEAGEENLSSNRLRYRLIVIIVLLICIIGGVVAVLYSVNGAKN